MHAPEVPPGYTWPLPLVYTVTVLAIAALYAPCRWYARVRAVRRWGWTSYI
jgi:hypothetical protein